MKTILRNILAVIAGAIACILINSALLHLMSSLNPPPEGFEPNDFSTYTLLQAKHLMNPYVAHSVPSIVGGLITALIAATRKLTCSMITGGLHMLGGLMAAFLIPAPAWYIALDLVTAYLPMAWSGHWIAGRLMDRSHRP